MDFAQNRQPEFLTQLEQLGAAAGLSQSERLIVRLLLSRRGEPVARSEILLVTVGLFEDNTAAFQLSEAISHINAALTAAGVCETIVLKPDGSACLVKSQ